MSITVTDLANRLDALRQARAILAEAGMDFEAQQLDESIEYTESELTEQRRADPDRDGRLSWNDMMREAA
jgi:hypothetical protein